jgi:tetratricopeptide (TPR) repeat protein
MPKFQCFAAALICLLAAGCAAFQVAGQVQSGRQALIMNQPETALGYFQQAAASDPNYIFHSVNFSESIWTYVGRGEYGLGKWAEARRSFERALSMYKDDAMAQIYLGLAMMQEGDQSKGMKQLQQGLKSLSGWIDFLNSNRGLGFWDPSGQIRKEIDKTLAAIDSERAEPTKEIIASAEWVGQQMEEEIDRVRSDEQRQRDRLMDGGFRRGSGVGIGIGF